jgi:uncharacterized membrane protein
MRSTITAIQMGIRALGVIQLVLGIIFWTGNALGLVDLHQLIGILLVLGLWTQAAMAHRAGVPGGLVAGAAVYGLLVPIVGLTQRDLFPGSAHWVIQVVHLLLGLGLLALAENLAQRAKARLAPVA